MKIIHTSDWHLGQTFYDYDRTPEHQDMLRQIVEIVKEEQPDAIVVSGDIFHTGNPVSRAIEMFNRAILEMHNASPAMEIVVTAGNHDSALRLTMNNDLWDYFKVHVIGNIAKNADENRTADYDRNIIEVRDQQGKALGYIAAVPHCYESNFPVSEPGQEKEERARSYFQNLSERISERNTQELPVVLMAHMAIEGYDPSGHDNVGGMEVKKLEIFGDGFDYIALGHIHSPHDIAKNARYCGTPVPVNFGEKSQHSVSIVTLEGHNDPKVRERPIRNLIPLLDFPAQPAPFSQVIEEIKRFPKDKRCYLRVMVKVDDSLTPLATTLIADAVKDKECRVCKLQPVMDEARSKKEVEHKSLSTSDLKEKTPVEIARMFFEMKGLEFSSKLEKIIDDATKEAELKKQGDEA